MSTPPQLPAGYQFEDQQTGPPKLPAGYQFETPATPPAPPTYLGEALRGAGRLAKGVLWDLPKAVLFPDNPLGVAGNLIQQGHRMLEAGAQSAESGEGRAGQTLSMMENAPVVGGMVRKAEEAGPGRAKFAPQTLGAVTEGSLTAALPDIVSGGTKLANKFIPSTTRAGAGLQALESTYGHHPMPVEAGHAAASDIVNRLAVTGEEAHPLIHAYLDRVNATDLANTHPEISGELQARGIPTENPLTFAEARQFLKRANDLKYEGNVGASARNQLSQFAKGLDQDIRAGATRSGFGEDYANMTKEYHRGSQIQRVADQAGPFVGGAAGAYLGRNLGGLGAAELGGAGALAGKYLGKPVIGSLVRSVIEREAGPPQINALPPTPPPPPMEATPSVPSAPPVTEGRRISSEPVATEQRVGGERRSDTAARAKFAAMTPEQQYQAAYTNPVTGLPNQRAFNEAGPAPVVGMTDVAGLKWLNDQHGMQAGDALLKAKAQALQQAGLDAFHTGGDEFKVRGTDPATLNNQLVRANEILRNSILEFTDAKTGKVEHYTGAEFRHGVGPDIKTAESSMMGKKAASKSRGTPGTLHRVPPPPEAIASD